MVLPGPRVVWLKEGVKSKDLAGHENKLSPCCTGLFPWMWNSQNRAARSLKSFAALEVVHIDVCVLSRCTFVFFSCSGVFHANPLWRFIHPNPLFLLAAVCSKSVAPVTLAGWGALYPLYNVTIRSRYKNRTARRMSAEGMSVPHSGPLHGGQSLGWYLCVTAGCWELRCSKCVSGCHCQCCTWVTASMLIKAGNSTL